MLESVPGVKPVLSNQGKVLNENVLM